MIIFRPDLLFCHVVKEEVKSSHGCHLFTSAAQLQQVSQRVYRLGLGLLVGIPKVKVTIWGEITWSTVLHSECFSPPNYFMC